MQFKESSYKSPLAGPNGVIRIRDRNPGINRNQARNAHDIKMRITIILFIYLFIYFI